MNLLITISHTTQAPSFQQYNPYTGHNMVPIYNPLSSSTGDSTYTSAAQSSAAQSSAVPHIPNGVLKPHESKTDVTASVIADTRFTGKSIVDKVTGKSRPLMEQITTSLPISGLSSTVSKLAPVLQKVKQSMDTSKKFDEARESLGEISRPASLFS